MTGVKSVGSLALVLSIAACSDVPTHSPNVDARSVAAPRSLAIGGGIPTHGADRRHQGGSPECGFRANARS